MNAVFFSYSHADETLRDTLEKHLAILKRQGVISTWHDRRLDVGDDVDTSISANLERSNIILLLVSADFLASDYCYGKEMLRAMELHRTEAARVIPIILRPCDWHHTPFGKLLAAPRDGKPVTTWPNQDEAFLEITKAIRSAAQQKQSDAGRNPHLKNVAIRAGKIEATKIPAATLDANLPRSSNLRLKKQFSEREKDAFLEASFEYIARYFENSLSELTKRNEGIEGSYKRIDTSRFVVVVYRNGKAVARCQIRTGTMHGGITFSHSADLGDNSINESVSAECDDQSLYLKAMGMPWHRQFGDKLSQEGAAEYYWNLFIEPLQS